MPSSVPDVLPVGVTPVTAVPTRIIHGEDSSLTVAFADAPGKTFEVRQLGEFATEQHNPNNIKHVTRVTITIPVSRLSEGVSFVDTPGLGSLATGGAAETLVYLPRCDLGVVLIDAGSTLTEEDVRTIRALQEARHSRTYPAQIKRTSSTGLTAKRPSGTSGST